MIEIREKLLEIIDEYIDNRKLTEADLDTPIKDFNVDSIEIFEMIMEVEEEFEIEITETESVNTINEFAQEIYKLTKEK